MTLKEEKYSIFANSKLFSLSFSFLESVNENLTVYIEEIRLCTDIMFIKLLNFYISVADRRICHKTCCEYLI